jgi:hypothetical protein
VSEPLEIVLAPQVSRSIEIDEELEILPRIDDFAEDLSVVRIDGMRGVPRSAGCFLQVRCPHVVDEEVAIRGLFEKGRLDGDALFGKGHNHLVPSVVQVVGPLAHPVDRPGLETNPATLCLHRFRVITGPGYEASQLGNEEWRQLVQARLV